VLARRGLVTEERLVELLSKEHGLPSVDIRQQVVSAEIVAPNAISRQARGAAARARRPRC